MNNKPYIPQNINDVAAVKQLKQLPFEAVKQDVPALLEWLQDAHWTVAEGIAKYLIPHVNQISKELIFILESDDSMWKYCVINVLIARSKSKLAPDLTEAIRKIAEHPSVIDAEDTVDEVAKSIMENKVLCG